MADAATAQMIRTILSDREPRELPSEGKRAAGVLVLCSSRGGYDSLILTKRTNKVEHHKGEISFPGGAKDLGDPDIIATALRETHEEIGIVPNDIEVLGFLNQDSTRTGYLISPVVGNLTGTSKFRASPYEVDTILEIPISHLLDPKYTQYEESVMQGDLISYNAYWYGTDLIWGATARILTEFINLTAHCFVNNSVS
jgi:8-oxo-dGTP pyrophosphatase MutT (NUDIX family)